MIRPDDSPPNRSVVSRRGFLKLNGAVALGLLVPPDPESALPAAASPIGLGRVIHAQKRYAEPSFYAAVLGTSYADEVVSIYAEHRGDAGNAPAGTEHNRVWYQVPDGWLHSGFVQPVRNRLNRPEVPEAIPAHGFLAEISVPFTDAWHADDRSPQIAYRFYYGQTHWVEQVIEDEHGNAWYQVLDDRY